MKVLSIVGARPQFIKEAVVQTALKKEGITEVLVNTGQHYDKNMSDIFFDILGMPQPQYNLNVGSGKHGNMTGRMIVDLEPIMEAENPDWVLVYGDTNSTLAGAVVASKLKIPIAHVEAGIRMLPKDMPEEINRVMVDSVSKAMFCPSRFAVDNLHREGKNEGVFLVGDVMYDLFLKMQPSFSHNLFNELKLTEGEFIVVTLHRDYNVDDPETLTTVLQQLSEIAKQKEVVFTVHPRTRKNIEKFNLQHLAQAIKMVEPLDYLNLMGLTQKAWKVVTDSGGYQKESYFAGKQAVVMMPDTGWRELTEQGFNVLSKPHELKDKLFDNRSPDFANQQIYGDGKSAEKIAALLKSFK